MGEAVEDLLIHRDFGIALRGLSLFHNNGDGTFTDVARQSGLDDSDSETNGGCAADYDNDGDLDI